MKDLQTAIKIGIAGIKHCIFCNRSGKPNVPDLWTTKGSLKPYNGNGEATDRREAI